MSAAIAGSEVAMTVESMFSMNRATATISGTMRLADMECSCWTFGTLRRDVRAFPDGVEFDRPYLTRQPVDTECLYPMSATVAGGGQGLSPPRAVPPVR